MSLCSWSGVMAIKDAKQIRAADWQPLRGTALRDFDKVPFVQKADRAAEPPFGYFMTTERCHLSCVMCHFNGPRASRRGETTIPPDLVRDVLERRPKGEKIWFVATGEFFSDPNAFLHIRTAASLGLSPRVITHGQFLTPDFIDRALDAGLMELLISVDSID